MHNRELQQKSFDDLVRQGVYSASSTHSAQAQAFVADVFQSSVLPKLAGEALNVLDCGCGPGFWSEFVATLLTENGRQPRLLGFDLSEQMVLLARERLQNLAAADDIRVGDLLEPSSYRIDDSSRADLMFAYDVIQQLPPQLQFKCIETALEQLADSGALVIFDHEKCSDYGRKMARKKWITKYLRVPLVPRYYCNANYPPLQKFAERLSQNTGCSYEIYRVANFAKQALIITKS